MRILSLVLRLKPEDFAATREALTRVPGAELALEDAAGGRQIVTLEDGEGYSVADSIVAVHQIPGLMSVTLAYEYADDDQSFPAQESTPCP